VFGTTKTTEYCTKQSILLTNKADKKTTVNHITSRLSTTRDKRTQELVLLIMQRTDTHRSATVITYLHADWTQPAHVAYKNTEHSDWWHLAQWPNAV